MLSSGAGSWFEPKRETSQLVWKDSLKCQEVPLWEVRTEVRTKR